MSPLLRIVNYFLKKKGIISNEEELDHFFDNGVSFPQFIAVAFNIDQIPNIVQKPQNDSQRNLNNNIALEFLFQENEEIGQISPSFYTTKDKSNLLSLILTKQCFKIKYVKIISKCNLIVQSLGLRFININDIIKKETIVALLHVLTDKKVQIDTETNDFNLLMTQIFEKAKVPLVIDETSLEPPNQFLFLIQILIIFEHFSDKIKQIKKQYLRNKDKLKFKENDELTDLALLKTINGILKDESLSFNSIVEAVRRENAYKFVKLFFKEDIEFTEKLNTSQKDIESIIKLLGTKDPIFNVLLFNFRDLKYEYSSSVLFYTNFLNCFFLKKSRQELFERCSTIIFSMNKRDDFFFNKLKENLMNKKNPYEDKSLLFMWETYLALLYFVNERSVHFKVHIQIQKNTYDHYFDKKNIPQIIDEDFIEKCNSQEKDALYYQLQFIFNALDEECFSYHYHEMMLTALRLVRNIKVPKYATLIENIRVKNVSLILQKKRYNKFLNGEKKEDVKVEIDELNMLKKEKPKKPETFKQRFVNKKKNENSSFSLQSAELFWNPIDNDYSVDNGILYKKNKMNESQKEWIVNIENYEKNVKKNSESFQNFQNFLEIPLFSSFPIKNSRSELNKFFRYNEKIGKWETDSSSISTFFMKKLFKETNSKIPFVLFSNSYENELIELTSKLINYLHPNLDEDEIYVYGLCDRNLSLLEYNVFLTQEKSQVKPILLFLHVPQRKRNIGNIRTILLKIHCFLSLICDVEVVVLNKDHYNDQIDFLTKINNIKSSYQKAAEMKEDKNSIVSLNYQFNSEDLSSDGDDDCVIDESLNQRCFNDLNNLIEDINVDCFKKQLSHILLMNDQSIHGDIFDVIENSFLRNIKNQIQPDFCDICYINVNDTDTYRCFLTSLNKICLKVSNIYDDVMKNFDLIKITEASNMYINIKSEKEWKCELKNVIENRFTQIKQFQKSDEIDDFSLIDKLHDEIMSSYPSIDSDFYNECNLILTEIKNNITKLNSEFLTAELNRSSENNLNYLKEIINGRCYWDNDQKDSIENSHINFLEEEFYSIIDEFYSKKNFQHVFSCCQSILQSRIERDIKIIKKYFADLEQKFNSSGEITQPFSMLDEINKRTDYSIRESEKVREIKAVVEAGHLIDEIEQDF